MKSNEQEERRETMLQGLGLVQAAVTERWLVKAEKNTRKSASDFF